MSYWYSFLSLRRARLSKTFGQVSGERVWEAFPGPRGVTMTQLLVTAQCALSEGLGLELCYLCMWLWFPGGEIAPWGTVQKHWRRTAGHGRERITREPAPGHARILISVPRCLPKATTLLLRLQLRRPACVCDTLSKNALCSGAPTLQKDKRHLVRCLKASSLAPQTLTQRQQRPRIGILKLPGTFWFIWFSDHRLRERFRGCYKGSPRERGDIVFLDSVL